MSAGIGSARGDGTASPVGVVVVNFASIRLIAANLGHLAGGAEPIRVVVVDNWSTADERAAARVVCADRGWTLVESPVNAGFGGGVNLGVRAAGGLGCECVVLLNPDARVEADVVMELRRHCLLEPDALVSPVIADSSGRVVFNGSQVDLATGRIRGLGPAARPVDGRQRLDGDVPGRLPGRTQGWLPGACLAMHRSLFDRVGGMYEPYFLYWEDVDLSTRVEAVGGTLVVRHDLRVIHDEGGTQESGHAGGRSAGYYYWNCRNRLLYAARNLPRATIVRWLLHTPRESWQILLRGGKRQFLHSLRPLWSGVRGSLSGVRLAVRAVVGRRPPALDGR